MCACIWWDRNPSEHPISCHYSLIWKSFCAPPRNLLREEPPQHKPSPGGFCALEGRDCPVRKRRRGEPCPAAPAKPARLPLAGIAWLCVAPDVTVLPGEKRLFLSLPFASAKRKDFFVSLISAFNGVGKAHFLPRANYVASSTALPLPFPSGWRGLGTGTAGTPAPQLPGYAAARKEVSHPGSTAHAGLPFLEARLRG